MVTWARGRIIRREDLLAFLLREQEVWSRGEGGEGGQVGCSYDGPCCAAQLAGDVLVQQVGGGQGGRVGGCWGHEEGCAGRGTQRRWSLLNPRSLGFCSEGEFQTLSERGEGEEFVDDMLSSLQLIMMILIFVWLLLLLTAWSRRTIFSRRYPGYQKEENGGSASARKN